MGSPCRPHVIYTGKIAGNKKRRTNVKLLFFTQPINTRVGLPGLDSFWLLFLFMICITNPDGSA